MRMARTNVPPQLHSDVAGTSEFCCPLRFGGNGPPRQHAVGRRGRHACGPAAPDRTDSTPWIAAIASIAACGTGLSTSTSVYAISPRDLLTMLWMLRPALAIAVEIWPSMFGTLALAMPMR